MPASLLLPLRLRLLLLLMLSLLLRFLIAFQLAKAQSASARLALLLLLLLCCLRLIKHFAAKLFNANITQSTRSNNNKTLHTHTQARTRTHSTRLVLSKASKLFVRSIRLVVRLSALRSAPRASLPPSPSPSTSSCAFQSSCMC